MKRGFTLVEVVIVLTVTAVLISLGIFAMNGQVIQRKSTEARWEATAIKVALEKYYSKHNEYPSMQQLAGGAGDGRNLTDAQYTNIAALLGINTTILKGGDVSFMPCWIESTVCCQSVKSQSCTTTSSDNDHIIYYTRTATDVASGTKDRTYNAYSSGCAYTLPAPRTPKDDGYTAYLLMYYDQSDPNPRTKTRVYSSDHGRTTHTDQCAVSQQS